MVVITLSARRVHGMMNCEDMEINRECFGCLDIQTSVVDNLDDRSNASVVHPGSRGSSHGAVTEKELALFIWSSAYSELVSYKRDNIWKNDCVNIQLRGLSDCKRPNTNYASSISTTKLVPECRLHH